MQGNQFVKGTFFHSTAWPSEGLDLKGKKVAVIGTGATAVQIIQESSKIVDQLTVFQRTPNQAIPMAQVDYSEQAKPPSAEEVKTSLEARTESFGGFDYSFLSRKCFDDTPEKRHETYEQLWKDGSFKYWLATYSDTLFDQAANRECYNFWRDKTRAMINGKYIWQYHEIKFGCTHQCLDPRIADLLAPIEPAYAFGTKRIPLEQGFFETFNEPHVKLVDLRTTPIETFTERGIKTSTEEMDFDVVIAATGFDALTGCLTRIDIKGKDGLLLRDHWKAGVKTYLGLTSHGFPNMFFLYGPQAPTVLCNGPTCAEIQGNWVIEAINHCRDRGFQKIEATDASAAKWRETVINIADSSLLSGTKSWYCGDNIPGKAREPLMYLGGLPTYYGALNAVRDNDYDGFVLEKGAGASKL